MNPPRLGNEELIKIFEASFLHTAIDDDGDLCVTSDNGLQCYVLGNAEVPLLKIATLCTLREDADESSKRALVDRLNNEVVLARFTLMADSTLAADYFLPFEFGVEPAQIVSALRWFSRCVVDGIRAFDSENLVI